MDIKKLAWDLLQIAEAAAPLVGMSEELEAGKALVAAVEAAVETVSGAADSEDQAALQSSLDALVARVNAHADATIAKLGG